MNYEIDLYRPIYETLGVDAVLTTQGSVSAVTITAIDKTIGVVVGEDVDVQTLAPAASLRMTEFLDSGLSLEDLTGATLTLNGKQWRVTDHRLKPSPLGENDGELYLLLIETTGSA